MSNCVPNWESQPTGGGKPRCDNSQPLPAAAWHELLFDNTADAIFVHDLEGRILDVNRGACESLRFTRDELRSLNVIDIDTTFSLDQARVLWHDLTEGPHQPRMFESYHRRKDGRRVPVEIRLTAFEMEGRQLILGVARDITDRKRAERRQTLMMRELDHRVKNTLASVVAITRETMKGASSLDEFESKFIGRVIALAKTHAVLAENRWEGVELAELVRQALAPYRIEDVDRVRHSGPQVMLSADRASPLCMSLHELATNAARHGALSHPDGKLQITWDFVDAMHVRIYWRETGGPSLHEPTGETGFGTRFIRGVFAHELGGSAQLDFTGEGLVAQLEFSTASRDTAGINDADIE